MGKAEKERKLKKSFWCVPTRPVIEISEKIVKKLKKKKRKHRHCFFLSQNKLGKAEKEWKKKIVPMSSYTTRNKKFQKNSKKILKKK